MNEEQTIKIKQSLQTLSELGLLKDNPVDSVNA